MRQAINSYRVQVRDGADNPADKMTLYDVADIVDYMDLLGITDFYSSPLTQGSTSHGYWVDDFNKIQESLGGEEALIRLSDKLKSKDMGFILDIVPNHMHASIDNPLWRDVLTYGPNSQFADFFEIEWDKDKSGNNQVLLPLLGDSRNVEIQNGNLKLVFDTDQKELFVQYWEKKFPIAHKTYGKILAGPQTKEPLSDDQISELFDDSEKVHAILDQWKSVEDLGKILDEQHFRLADWQAGLGEINYRRFFDINDLAGLMQEKREVFEYTHQYLFELIDRGIITGLRIDHPDGLAYPGQYLNQLSQAIKDRTGKEIPIWVEKILEGHEKMPEDWHVQGDTGYKFLNQVNQLFVNAKAKDRFTKFYGDFTGHTEAYETVLEDCLNAVMDGEFHSEMERLVNRGYEISNNGQNTLEGITERSLWNSMMALIRNLGVYRTYFDQNGVPTTDADVQILKIAAEKAKQDIGFVNDGSKTVDFIAGLIYPKYWEETGYADKNHLKLEAYSQEALQDFRRRVQQLSGPVRAKGMEDTSYYRYNRMIALNEVGGDPDQFGLSADEFHSFNQERLNEGAQTMLASATHDTKRGEDTRSKIAALTSIPDEWENNVLFWSRILQEYRTKNPDALDKQTKNPDECIPTKNDVYFFLQTVTGAWPADFNLKSTKQRKEFKDRIQACMEKSVKEAKRHMSWIGDPEYTKPYGDALHHFIDKALSDQRFLDSMAVFQKRLGFAASVESLSRTVIKTMSPGLVDTYQGRELWDNSLVDPDNRRPLDVKTRLRKLENWMESQPASLRLLDNFKEADVKLYVLQKMLWLRKSNPDLFVSGGYEGLKATTALSKGQPDSHIVSVLRQYNDSYILSVSPNHVADQLSQITANPKRLAGVFNKVSVDVDGHIPDGTRLKEIFTGKTVTVKKGQINLGRNLRYFPQAVFVNDEVSLENPVFNPEKPAFEPALQAA